MDATALRRILTLVSVNPSEASPVDVVQRLRWRSRTELVTASTRSVGDIAASRVIAERPGDSLPWCVAFNVRSRRAAKRDFVASGRLHDTPDRIHNDFWLVDLHDVTGLWSDHQASSF